jgi:hypothetical protein
MPIGEIGEKRLNTPPIAQELLAQVGGAAQLLRRQENTQVLARIGQDFSTHEKRHTTFC